MNFELIIPALIFLIALAVLYFLIVRRGRNCGKDGGKDDGKDGGKDGGNRRAGKHKVKDLDLHPRSKSEAKAIKILEELTGDKFPTVYPSWLRWKGRTLELDGFNGSIALEFSGPLHTKWNPAFEPYEKYFERIVRDVVKQRICRKKGVHLIVLDMSLPAIHWRAYLSSRLYDIGRLKFMPPNYIPAQTAEPFRNVQLEKELGLEREMEMAASI